MATTAIQNHDGSFTVDGVVYPNVGSLERARRFPKNALRSRLNGGWPLDRALAEPVDAGRAARTRAALGTSRKGGRPRTNAAAVASLPENATSAAIREHLEAGDARFPDRRLWWRNLGLLYAALKTQSFTTARGTTRPGFYAWLAARGLMPFPERTAKAAMDLAQRWEEVRRSPAFAQGLTHPTDLVAGLGRR